jgi:hypothetical protein
LHSRTGRSSSSTDGTAQRLDEAPFVTGRTSASGVSPAKVRRAGSDGIGGNAHLSPELEGKLALAADRRGLSVEVLAREARKRAVDYDDWFLREVETGLAQIDA